MIHPEERGMFGVCLAVFCSFSHIVMDGISAGTCEIPQEYPLAFQLCVLRIHIPTGIGGSYSVYGACVSGG